MAGELKTGALVTIARGRVRVRSLPILAAEWPWSACPDLRPVRRACALKADAVDHGGALISRRARSLAGSVGLPL